MPSGVLVPANIVPAVTTTEPAATTPSVPPSTLVIVPVGMFPVQSLATPSAPIVTLTRGYSIPPI